MKTRVIKILLVILGFFVISYPSLAIEYIIPAKIDQISIECERCGNIHIANVYIYQEGDKFKVAGTVKRDYNFRSRDLGFIDVILLTSEGEVLEEICTSFVPRIIPRKGSHESRFSVLLSTIPPEGSRVQIKPCCHNQKSHFHYRKRGR